MLMDDPLYLEQASPDTLLELCISGEIHDLNWPDALFPCVWRIVLSEEMSHANTWTLFCTVLEKRLMNEADNNIIAKLMKIKQGAPFLYCIYWHRTDLRPTIRSALGVYLKRLIGELKMGKFTDQLWPTLEGHLRLVGCIAGGMTPPRVHDVGTRLLQFLLLPLHTPNGMVLWRDQRPVLAMYHEALVFATVKLLDAAQIAESESAHLATSNDAQSLLSSNTTSLLVLTVRGLIHQWPRGFDTNTPREVLLLHELDHLLGRLRIADLSLLLTDILDLLATCFTHDNAIPLQRALEIFRNSAFCRLCASSPTEDRRIIIRRLVPPLFRRGSLHWNVSVNKMTANVIEALRDIDPLYFDTFARETFTVGKVGGINHDSNRGAISNDDGIHFRAAPRPPTTASLSKAVSHVSSSVPRVAGIPLVVAPWAMQTRAVPEAKRHSVDHGTESLPQDGLAIIMRYCSICRGPAKEEKTPESSLALRRLELKFHDLVFGRELGRGAFSVVKYAKMIQRGSESSTWPEVAVKVISSESEGQSDDECAAWGGVLAALREVAVLRMIEHPSIARLIASFRYNRSAYLVLELGSRGDLHSLVMSAGALSEEQTRFIVGEVLGALLSLRSLGLLFLDLKPENVLVTAAGHVKLTDFGACRPFTDLAYEELKKSRIMFADLSSGGWRDDENEDKCTTKEARYQEQFEESLLVSEGTPGYMPREMLLRRLGKDEITDDTLVDAWSLGCLISFCINGRPLFYGTTEEVVTQLDDVHRVPKSVSFSIIDPTPSSSYYHGARKGRSLHLLTLLDGLLATEISCRWSLDLASKSLFLFEDGNNDPLCFYLNSPTVTLPSPNEIKPSSEDTAKWARRQLSVVWAPMPAQYNFSASSGDNSSQLSRFTNYVDILMPIPEAETEIGSYF